MITGDKYTYFFSIPNIKNRFSFPNAAKFTSRRAISLFTLQYLLRMLLGLHLLACEDLLYDALLINNKGGTDGAQYLGRLITNIHVNYYFVTS